MNIRIAYIFFISLFLWPDLSNAQVPGWTQKASLTIANPYHLAYAGWSVDIDGDFAIVGTTQHNYPMGAAWMFKKNLNGNWVEHQVIDYPNTSLMGVTVAIEGNIAVLGAFPEDNVKGAVYIFEKNLGDEWVFAQRLIASDRQDDDRFGTQIDISGNSIAILAPGVDLIGANDFGAIYMFHRQTSGNWSQTNKLFPNDFIAGNSISSISLFQNQLAIGVSGDDNFGSNSGAVYLFLKTGSPSSWAVNRKIKAFDKAAGDKFGARVSINGDRIAITSPGDNQPGGKKGSVYVVEKNNGWWNNFEKLTSALDNFGADLSLTNNRLAIGTNPEIVSTGLELSNLKIYDLVGVNTWQLDEDIQVNGRYRDDIYEHQISMDGNTILLGEYGFNGHSGRGVIVEECVTPNILNLSATQYCVESTASISIEACSNANLFYFWRNAVTKAYVGNTPSITVPPGSYYCLVYNVNGSTQSDPILVTNNAPTGSSCDDENEGSRKGSFVDVNSNVQEIKIFPNPTKGVVSILIPKSQLSEIILLSLDGKQIKTNPVLRNSLIELNLENLPKGVYILEITTQEGKVVEKIILN